jgi:hypothetical protein
VDAFDDHFDVPRDVPQGFSMVRAASSSVRAMYAPSTVER